MKKRSEFSCVECGYTTQKWLGRCPMCESWDSFKEESISKDIGSNKKITKLKNQAIKIDEVEYSQENRVGTGIKEFDRVLGGGIVEGSLILIGGDPGIGKSTMLMEVVKKLGSKYLVLYVSGEESMVQIKLRGDRIGISNENILLLAERDMERILDTIDEISPKYIVIDSIQTMYLDNVSGVPGSISQVRESSLKFLELAKEKKITVILVGHVTKSGNIAGPKTLEHMVDVVLYLEGDKNNFYRMLKSEKNRFGSTNELGIFKMEDFGLVEVGNPSVVFLTGIEENVPGSVLVPSLEGNQVILVEIQLLAIETYFPVPRRIATGFDLNRLNLLTAVLEKKIKYILGKSDIYCNVVGGIKINDRALDLGVCIALISSIVNKPISRRILFAGEIGLTGELRMIPNLEKRIAEGSKLGYSEIIIPKGNYKKEKLKIKVIEMGSLNDVTQYIFPEDNS